jgi:hypothetical protein
MKKFLTISIALSSFAITNLYSASDFYDQSSRKISVKFEEPVDSVAVHIVGTNGKNCVKPKSIVKTMNFIPASSVQKDTTLSGGLGLKKNGASATISATSSKTASYQTPAVYSYNYTGLISNLHYNIVYTKNGKQTALGWRPDNGGGCTYPLP